MFSQLVLILFPALGQFFGIVSGLASARFYDTWNYILGFVGLNRGDVTITCYNLFNGSEIVLSQFGIPEGQGLFNKLIINALNSFLSLIVPNSVLNSPFWVGLLYMFLSSLLAVAIIRFALSLIRG